MMKRITTVRTTVSVTTSIETIDICADKCRYRYRSCDNCPLIQHETAAVGEMPMRPTGNVIRGNRLVHSGDIITSSGTVFIKYRKSRK